MKKFLAPTAAFLMFPVVILVAGVSAGNAAQVERDAANAEYCEMVQLSKDTRGEFGWPDYNNNFNRVCR